MTNWNESLSGGIRRDHRASCPSSDDRKPRRACGCPYSFWVPDRNKRSGQRRERVDGSLSLSAARREKERLIVLARERNATNTPQAVDTHPTMREWAKRCMTKSWASLSGNTRTNRERAYRLYIDPHLGAITLREVTALVVSDWCVEIEKPKGRNRATEQAVETLRAMMNIALDLDLIDKNPVRKVPRVPRSEVRASQKVLAAHQYRSAVANLVELADRVLFRVAAECCLRRGELAALRWCDIDFDARRMIVARSVVKGEGGVPTISDRKSGGVARPSFSEDLARELTRLREQSFEAGGAADAPVWPGRGPLREPWRSDLPMTPDSMGRRVKQVIVDAGLVDDSGRPLVSAHGLRRTGASLAAEAGVPEVIVQNQLGHATPDTTREFYVKRTDEALQDRFADVFAV